MKLRHFVAFLLTLWLLPGTDLGAQERFRDTTSVLVVEIPVEVTRNGEPVRGLTADDFEVFDGRKKREIVGFDVVDLTLEAEPSERASLPTAARRHFLLLFDLSFSDPSAIVRARQGARRLVEEDLHPSDLVAVATYSARQGARIILGFTSDRRQAALAIESLGLPQLLEEARDPLGLVLADVSDFRSLGEEESGVGGGGGGVGALAGIDAEQEIRETITRLERETNQASQRNAILALAGSMTELADLLNSVDGRKHLVYLSEGFDSSQMVGLGLSAEEIRRGQELNEAAMSGEFWEVDSEERFGSTSTLNELEVMVQELVRSDCTVQAVDIGGLRAEGSGGSRGGEHGLSYLASSTGGEFYRNTNDIGEAMSDMLERTSVTYVLAIQPQDLEADGEFHRLRVKTKGNARGFRLVHRPGYFAPKPFTEQSAEERRMVTAGLIMGGREGGPIDSAVLAAAFPAAGERFYVPVLIEIDGSSLLAGTDENVLPAELYAYALDGDGRVSDFFTRVLGLDLTKIRSQLSRTGFKYWGHFELAPGDYTVRVLVRNGVVGSTGLHSSPLRVPALQETALLPPLIPEPQGKWLLGREENVRAFDYPFLFGQQPFIPAARPALEPGAESALGLVAYELGGEAVELTAELVDAQGRKMPVSDLQVAAREAAGSGLERLQASFRCPAEAAPGEYELVVSVDAGGVRSSSSIPVRVEG